MFFPSSTLFHLARPFVQHTRQPSASFYLAHSTVRYTRSFQRTTLYPVRLPFLMHLSVQLAFSCKASLIPAHVFDSACFFIQRGFHFSAPANPMHPPRTMHPLRTARLFISHPCFTWHARFYIARPLFRPAHLPIQCTPVK